MKMSDDQKYAELKKVLRATLISIKRNGVPLRTLEQIYQEREGRKIPLHGHSDTFALLHSMTDTVCTVSTQQKNVLFMVKKAISFLLHQSLIKTFWNDLEMGWKSFTDFSCWYRKYTAHFRNGGWTESVQTTVNIFINSSIKLTDWFSSELVFAKFVQFALWINPRKYRQIFNAQIQLRKFSTIYLIILIWIIYKRVFTGKIFVCSFLNSYFVISVVVADCQVVSNNAMIFGI